MNIIETRGSSREFYFKNKMKEFSPDRNRDSSPAPAVMRRPTKERPLFVLNYYSSTYYPPGGCHGGFVCGPHEDTEKVVERDLDAWVLPQGELH